MKAIIDIITFPFRLLLWIPVSILSAPRRLLGMTLPMRVAVITAFFLIAGVLLILLVKALTATAPGLANFFYPWWAWAIVVPICLVVIPITLYYTVKLWLEGDVSNFPDIDLAWNRGLAVLAQNGYDLANLPIFLILGVADDKQVQALMAAANLNFRVKGAPEGAAALHWFATDQAIYVACTQIGRASKLANMAAHLRVGENAPGGPPQRQATYGGTMVVGGGGTMAEGTMADGGGTRVQVSKTEVEPAAAPMPGATMVFGPQGGGTFGGPTAANPANLVKLSKEQEQTETARLEYLAHLLSRARQPVCPANGVLTVLPFKLLQRAAEGFQLRDAVKADLTTLRQQLKLRCPTVALVTGMELEVGFLELIKRVGPEPAKVQRFGKGFNVHNRPTSEQLNAVGTHACGAFEDFVYAQFSKPEALRQVGNRKLYALLCKIRAEIQPRLTSLLDSAFSDDADENEAADEQAMLFGGCYFAATGEGDGSRAFVKSVLEKLTDLENDVEWTQEALDENDRYHRLAQMGFLADGLLLTAVVAVLFWWIWWRNSQ